MRAVRDGLLQCVLGAGVVRRKIGPDRDGVAERLLELLPPLVMLPDPRAFLRRAFMYERRAERPAGDHPPGQQPEKPGAGCFRLRVGLHLDLSAPRVGGQLRPDRADGFFQLRRPQHAQIAQRIRVQPHQKRFRRRDGRLLAELVIGCAEGIERGQKRTLFPVRPDVVGVKAQRGLQLGIVADAVEMHLIQAAQPVKVQKFIIDPHSRIIGIDRQNARDIRADGRRVEALEDADALVALLHVEAAHIFKATDGIRDARVAQVRLAERDPLACKLRPKIQKRHEIRGKRRLPPRRICADDLRDGNVQYAEIDAARDRAAAQPFLEHLRIRIASAVDAIAVAFLPGLERLPELLQRLLSAHIRHLLF